MSILTPKYNTSARDAINLKGSLPVRSIDEIKRRIADADEGSLVFIADIWTDRATVTIPAGKNFDISGNNYRTDILFVIESGAAIQFSSVIFTSALSGAGSITATDCEFADVAFTGNIDGIKTSGCSFGTTLTTGICSNSEISGTTGSVDNVLLCGLLVDVKVDLACGLDSSTNPADSNINITGDWVNAPAGGTGCNIFARNFTTTSSPIPAAFVVDGDYGDVTVSGSGTSWTIDNSVVSNAKMRNSAGLSVLGRSANSTGVIADITAASDNTVLRRSGSAIGFGNIPESTVTNLVTDLAARVVGPASSDDNALARFDGTTGKLIQNSSVTLDDNGLFAWAASINGQMDCDKTITLNADNLKNDVDLLKVQRFGVDTATVRAAGELVVGRTSANILLSDHLKTNRFGWDSEPTTFITHPAGLNVLDIYSVGTLTARFSDYQILANQDDPTTPAYSFQEAVNSGLTLNAALDTLLLVNNNETVARIQTDGVQVTSSGGTIVEGNAFIRQSSTTPYTFHNQVGTGFGYFNTYGTLPGIATSINNIRQFSVSGSVATTTATATVLRAFPLATASQTRSISFHIIGHRTNNINEVVSYQGTVRAKNNAGTVTAVMVISTTNEEIAACTVTATVSGTNVRINVVGVAANNIDWVGWFNVLEAN